MLSVRDLRRRVRISLATSDGSQRVCSRTPRRISWCFAASSSPRVILRSACSRISGVAASSSPSVILRSACSRISGVLAFVFTIPRCFSVVYASVIWGGFLDEWQTLHKLRRTVCNYRIDTTLTDLPLVLAQRTLGCLRFDSAGR